jgi:hypothetical protein
MHIHRIYQRLQIVASEVLEPLQFGQLVCQGTPHPVFVVTLRAGHVVIVIATTLGGCTIYVAARGAIHW